MVLVAVLVAPEVDGLGREGLGADQFSLLPLYRLARLVEHLHREAEAAALALAAIDGAQGVADDEAGADVGAAGDGAELHILFDPLIDIVKPLRREHRSGAADKPQVR
ncbi:hypothetical protein D3C72_1148060 [compost metagenome]